MDHEQEFAKIAELLHGAHICIMTTIDDDGQLVSRPMALQETDFNGELWFFSSDQSHKIAHISRRPEVNLAVEHRNSYISISGEAVVVDDKAKAEELWSPAMKGWFPDGVETPDLALIKVTATSAQYWDTGSKRLVSLLAYAKATVTGQRPDTDEIGESQHVDFEN